MSLRDKLSGAIAPLFTPFTADGAVDHDSLTRMVQWQLANGSSGISIGGSGEVCEDLRVTDDRAVVVGGAVERAHP